MQNPTNFHHLNDKVENNRFCTLTTPFPTPSIEKALTVWGQCQRRQVLDRMLNRASAQNLTGFEHFTQYLLEKYRRNCRPNTLRLTGGVLISFLSFTRNLEKTQIDQICRQDIEAFVEHEQDRGLKPKSVYTRICVLYAFLRYLITNKILGPEMLERRITLRLPESLPRAIEPEHIRQLLSVIGQTRDRALMCCC